MAAITGLVREILSTESDYYAIVTKDPDCVGNRNVVIKLYDDYRTDTKIATIGRTIRKTLSDAKYDVATDNQQPLLQALDMVEGVSKRCVVIRTSEKPKEKTD
jgi:hypothetical protein